MTQSKHKTVSKQSKISYYTFKKTVREVFYNFCREHSTDLRWDREEPWDSRVYKIDGFFYEMSLLRHNGPLPSWRNLWKQPRFTELARITQSWSTPTVEFTTYQSEWSEVIANLAKEVGHRTGVPIDVVHIC